MESIPINQRYISKNYDPSNVEVEFLLIHYSAVSLTGLFKLFEDEQSKVSSHFAISEDGEIFEIVPCLHGNVYRAWHAGNGAWILNEKKWNDFNSVSIGIELINYNGNLFTYPDRQMTGL